MHNPQYAHIFRNSKEEFQLVTDGRIGKGWEQLPSGFYQKTVTKSSSYFSFILKAWNAGKEVIEVGFY